MIVQVLVIAGVPTLWLWHPVERLTAEGESYILWALTPGGR